MNNKKSNLLENIKQKTKEKKQGYEIPQSEIDALARVLLPAIQKLFETEEGQREFAEWKANRDKQKLNKN